ncbi:thioesterase II family protein [Desulfovibrio desulfuricans]|mgnify:CR=1 FL=1|uniref:thioesterase II family protein n=1 Tax=Desulfovibrio desulfuricans TaxID=876 RepID=UPI0035AF8BC9
MPHSADTTLFCIPHAGGNAAYFAQFCALFPAAIGVRPLDLPGKGRRFREPLPTSMEVMGRDLFAQMRPTALNRPYAIFGHSMGGLLAFVCARMASEANIPLPKAIFISSVHAPDKINTGIPGPVAQLPPGKLWDHVVRMGGTPPDVAHSNEFRSYIEPLLAADFAAVESWQPAPCPPLPMPIHIVLGSEDIITEADALHWQKLSAAPCTVRTFSGGHFYLQSHWQELAEHLTRTLAA